MVTNPLERSTLADRMEAMVTLGPPLTPGKPADPKALALHQAISQALAEAAREPLLAELLTRLRDKELAQTNSIGMAMAAIDRLNIRDSEDRVRDFGRATGAREVAETLQREIVSLRTECNLRLAHTAWRRLTPEQQELAKKLRPDFATAAQGSVSESTLPREQKVAAKDGWLSFQFPDTPFAVDMPGKPQRTGDDTYELELNAPAAVYSMGVADIGCTVEDLQARGLVEQLFTVLSQSLMQHSGENGGTLSNTKIATLQGNPGREYTWSFESRGAKKVARACFFMVDRQLVSIGLVRDADTVIEPQEQTFFDSLRIVQEM
jgi:hypothetical protein